MQKDESSSNLSNTFQDINKLSIKPIKLADQEENILWDKALSSEDSDRALTIIALCILDQLLQKLIRKAFVSHRKSDFMFREEHLLRTTSSKINMAFFLGLIPNILYDDLKIMNNIRNKFAHTTTDRMTFDSPSIYNLLVKCKLGPTNLGASRMAKWRFTIAIQQLIDYTLMCINFYERFGPKKLVEIARLNDMPLHETGLSKEKLLEIERTHRIKQWYMISPSVQHDGVEESVCIDLSVEAKDGDMVMYELKDNEKYLGVLKIIDGARNITSVAGKILYTASDCKTIAKIVRKMVNY